MAAYDFVSTTTAQHTITIKDGSLTITGSDMTLLPDETEELLNTLLVWRYGLQVILSDDIEE